MLDPSFWNGRNVFLTGHTGFKGSWMILVLARLGARIHGYALAPETSPSMFDVLGLAELCESHVIADIRDPDALAQAVDRAQPEIAIHMAAQPIVSASYERPVETFDVNVMGTVHFLEACRRSKPATIVVASSDKCYRNMEDARPFKTDSPLGGKDPYSASKAGTELVVESWRYAFIEPEGVSRLASARAGNVIGGGDWSENRLLPDAARAFSRKQPLAIRNPEAMRPWQHVLEPVVGYLMLAERLTSDAGLARAWNFGPNPPVGVPVKVVADAAVSAWPGSPGWQTPESGQSFGEAKTLLLDCEETVRDLGWTPRLSVEEAVEMTMNWYQAFYEGGAEAVRATTEAQISGYLRSASS